MSAPQKEMPTGAGTTAGNTEKHTHDAIVNQVANTGKTINATATSNAKATYTGFQRAKDSLLALTACTMLEVTP